MNRILVLTAAVVLIIGAAIYQGSIEGRWGARGASEAVQAFAARLDVHGIRPGWTAWLDDDTIVCRCESVRKATIDEYAAASSRGMRLATRAGLGACQGRTCGRSVADILGAKPSFDHRPVSDNRPVLSSVRIGELAALAGCEDGAQTPETRSPGGS